MSPLELSPVVKGITGAYWQSTMIQHVATHLGTLVTCLKAKESTQTLSSYLSLPFLLILPPLLARTIGGGVKAGDITGGARRCSGISLYWGVLYRQSPLLHVFHTTSYSWTLIMYYVAVILQPNRCASSPCMTAFVRFRIIQPSCSERETNLPDPWKNSSKRYV